jgi:hypothetical protein
MGSAPRTVIDRLIAALNLRTQAQLAARLGIRPQSIISAIRRGEIPEAWLYRVAYLSGRRVEWLRTGKGSIWHEVVAEAPPEPYGPALRRVLTAWKGLDAERQAAVERCAELLSLKDRDIRAHLIRQLKLIEETARVRQGKRASPSRRPVAP